MRSFISKIFVVLLSVFATITYVNAQSLTREFQLNNGGVIEIRNPLGRIEVETDDKRESSVLLAASSSAPLTDRDFKIKSSDARLKIELLTRKSKSRVDLKLKVPIRTRMNLITDNGAIHVIGDFAEAKAMSSTGTIYADVSLENVKYRFQWTASKPRVVAEVELADVKEKAAGRFQIKGRINEADETSLKKGAESGNASSIVEENDKKVKPGPVNLDFMTARGIVLLNVSPNDVPSNLRERPLTDAAKAIIRSGDSMLTSAIRRASPKYFGEYAATLPPRDRMPVLSPSEKRNDGVNAGIKRVTVQVTDINNRAILGLQKHDFVLSERGDEREVLSVEPTTAPFNLILLLDVSGSVEHYVDFIRKAARNFINTTSRQDKIAITTFNEDVHPLSGFTTDRGYLSESLDTFDAGGGTGYYDSLAFSLTETLRPLKGERTAIVVLSDGDDNRSFLSFNSLLGSIEESGALIYPLYVPSGLIAASAASDPNRTVDPLRSRFMSLTSKAQGEGEKLAKASGGVYYPISRLSDLQVAYNDIVLQLRTAYTLTYRSATTDIRKDRASPKLKVKVKRDTAFVKLGPIVAAGKKSVSVVKKVDSKQRKTGTDPIGRERVLRAGSNSKKPKDQ